MGLMIGAGGQGRLMKRVKSKTVHTVFRSIAFVSLNLNGGHELHLRSRLDAMAFLLETFSRQNDMGKGQLNRFRSLV